MNTNITGICIINNRLKLETFSFDGKQLISFCRYTCNEKIYRWKHCFYTETSSYIMYCTCDQFYDTKIALNKFAEKYGIHCRGAIHLGSV